jgi:predicted RNA-binding protein with PIN domain
VTDEVDKVDEVDEVDKVDEVDAVPPLPAAVRQRVVAVAADALGRMAADEVPATLRQVARFTPARRAKAGASALAAALDGDPVFRQRVAGRLRERSPELVAAVEAGAPPAAADAVEVAVAAYLVRPEGWPGLVGAAVSEQLAADERGRLADLQAQVDRLETHLRSARSAAEEAATRATAQTQQLRTDLAEARRRVRELEADLGRARSSASDALAAAAAAKAEAERVVGEATAQARRARSRVEELEAALDAARRAGRGERDHDEVRLRLLLDTVLGAAAGLRQELALPPADPAVDRPADRVASGGGAQVPAGPGVADVAARARGRDDPGLLDQLLALPGVHLVVDGYNVTKSGYGTLALEQQRARLVAGLAALAARTRAEVTCVFDGTAAVAPTAPSARGVRVLFSADGQTADELIDRLVRAEPPGRPVVVVSSDNEVAGRATAAGARAVPSTALLRRLDRA